MKKIILFALVVVFMLAVAGYVVADNSIKANGYHNIVGRLGLIATTEVCAYCHIPHRANVSSIPLGNRTASNPTDLCQSCHDGATQVDAGILRNPLTGDLPGGLVGGSAVIAAGTHIVGGINHPAGIVGANTYGWSANGPDGKVNPNAGLDTPANAQVALALEGYAPDPVLAADSTVHCTSCHYVHRGGVAADRAFLRISNVSSALCIACHNL